MLDGNSLETRVLCLRELEKGFVVERLSERQVRHDERQCDPARIKSFMVANDELRTEHQTRFHAQLVEVDGLLPVATAQRHICHGKRSDLKCLAFSSALGPKSVPQSDISTFGVSERLCGGAAGGGATGSGAVGSGGCEDAQRRRGGNETKEEEEELTAAAVSGPETAAALVCSSL